MPERAGYFRSVLPLTRPRRVERWLHLPEAQQLTRLYSAIERARMDLGYRIPKLTHRRSHCARLFPSLIVQLALLGDVLEMEGDPYRLDP